MSKQFYQLFLLCTALPLVRTSTPPPLSFLAFHHLLLRGSFSDLHVMGQIFAARVLCTGHRAKCQTSESWICRSFPKPFPECHIHLSNLLTYLQVPAQVTIYLSQTWLVTISRLPLSSQPKDMFFLLGLSVQVPVPSGPERSPLPRPHPVPHSTPDWLAPSASYPVLFFPRSFLLFPPPEFS